MPGEETSVESKQAKFCVLVIVIGAGLFLIGTSLFRNDRIIGALSILGTVVFLVGTFTLLLVLTGFTAGRNRQNSRNQAESNSTDDSPSSYDPEALYLAHFSPREIRSQTDRSNANQWMGTRPEISIISLPEYPKIITPVALQPPPTYEEAIAMPNSTARTDTAGQKE